MARDLLDQNSKTGDLIINFEKDKMQETSEKLSIHHSVERSNQNLSPNASNSSVPVEYSICKQIKIFAQIIKCTLVGYLNLSFYEFLSKFMPCSLWLKITTSLLNTLSELFCQKCIKITLKTA